MFSDLRSFKALGKAFLAESGAAGTLRTSKNTGGCQMQTRERVETGQRTRLKWRTADDALKCILTFPLCGVQGDVLAPVGDLRERPVAAAARQLPAAAPGEVDASPDFSVDSSFGIGI